MYAAVSASAQDTGVNSPLSRYGLGLLSNQAQGFNQGMAGLAYGMRDGRELNYKNPASYSAIDSLTFLFDIGMSLQNGNFDTGTMATNAKNASFDYLSMGFRINRGLGMSLGVMPISNIGYGIVTPAQPIQGSTTGETKTSSYSGNGGLHEVYLGLGYAPIKQLSFGVNGGFVWGAMTHATSTSFSTPGTSTSSIVYNTDVLTYSLDAGMQWEQKVNKKNSFTLGLNYGLGHDIASKSYRAKSSNADAPDEVSHAWSLPNSYGVGLAWKYNNLRVGADYSLQQWSKAKQPDYNLGKAVTGGYDDRHCITLGAEYVKDPQGLSWADRVRYRAGFSTANSYAKVSGKTGPRSYLASLGAALPIINLYNNRTFVSVAFQYERVQPQVSGQLTENYFRLCLGINFNERWFMKWKVE